MLLIHAHEAKYKQGEMGPLFLTGIGCVLIFEKQSTFESASGL